MKLIAGLLRLSVQNLKFARFMENAVCCPGGLVPFVRSVRLLRLWKLWDLARK